MANTAFQTIYRQEYIAGFEARQSLLRNTVVTEAQVQGNQAIFLVADSGSATAVTRGSDGLIPSRNDNLNQNTCVLTEYHDKVIKTDFVIDASQSNQRKIMQETTMATMNRQIDDLIIAQLDTATLNTGTSATASLDLITKAIGILGSNDVAIDESENMFGVITSAFYTYLLRIKEFKNAEYVSGNSFNEANKKMIKFAGVNWIVSTRITGKGTSTEKCYLYHKNSVGHAVHKDTIQSVLGYDEEDAYSYCRTSISMGSKLLQNNGVIRINHDGSAIVSA
jgi:hypothetical protein